VAALLLAGVFAGCGSDDDSATGSSSSGSEEITVETGDLSKAQFVKQAGANCIKAKSQFNSQFAVNIQDLRKRKSTAARVEALPAAVRGALVPAYEEMIEKTSALGAPAGDEEDVSEFLTALQQDLDTARANPTEAIRTGAPFRHSAQLAYEYGLTGCVQTLG